MLPRKIFKNLHTAMAILALFVQFSDKGCSYFWSLLLSASPNTMHFVFYAQFSAAWRSGSERRTVVGSVA